MSIYQKPVPKFLQDYLNEYEAAVFPLAEKYVPEGSDVRAVTDHWLFAYINYEKLPSISASAEASNVLRIIDTVFGDFYTRDELRSEIYKFVRFPPRADYEFKFIDLFAGIGGFRIALQNIGGLCVFSSEWDKSAQQTYLRNYGELPYGDITKIVGENVPDDLEESNIPDHDILAAGFPCQPFSHAGVSARMSVGKKHGFECETQGTLFFDVMRAAQLKRPKVLFLENVRNIERHNGGYTFDVIQRSIDELGYSFKHAIIDSSSVVPQRRKRCFMVCFDKELKVDFEFPDFEGEPLALRSILDANVDEVFTISDRLWEGHIKRSARNVARGTGFTAYTADLDKPSNTIVARYGKDGKECLIPQDGKNPRLLTPKECARLQGYPDSFLVPEARTPAYKQFGNSVTVPVVERIAERIMEYLK